MSFSIKKTPTDKVIPVALPINAREKLTDLAFHLKLKMTGSVVKLFTDLVEDPDLLKEFSGFVEAINTIDIDKIEVSHTNFSSAFRIQLDLLEKLDKIRAELRILEMSRFVRYVIYFFHDRLITSPNKKHLKKLESFLKKEGYQIKHIGTIQEYVYFIGISPTPLN